MFDNPYFILKAISVASFVALIIYRIQLLKLVRTTFFRRKGDPAIANKVSKYIHLFNSRRNIDADRFSSIASIKPPDLHLLKSISDGNRTCLYISNRGGSIYDVVIKSPDVSSVTIEPCEKLISGSSGCIKFLVNKSELDKIILHIAFSDEQANRKNVNFSFDFSQKEFVTTN